MSAPSDPQDNVVVPYNFRCTTCGTGFCCNRAEPFCITDHPGQYHLQKIEWSEHPCEMCETWRKPYEESEARYARDDPDDKTVLLYPPLEKV